MEWLIVFLGGGIGSIARFFIFRNMTRIFPTIPMFISTLIVNAVGCLFIGLLFAHATTKSSSDSFRYFWLVGFLGGLTTFSTLGLDIFQLIQQKSVFYASAYFLFHGTICIFLVYAGYSIYSVR